MLMVNSSILYKVNLFAAGCQTYDWHVYTCYELWGSRTQVRLRMSRAPRLSQSKFKNNPAFDDCRHQDMSFEAGEENEGEYVSSI